MADSANTTPARTAHPHPFIGLCELYWSAFDQCEMAREDTRAHHAALALMECAYERVMEHAAANVRELSEKARIAAHYDGVRNLPLSDHPTARLWRDAERLAGERDQ